MIIVKISDGLGNQLFQYAYARALKEKTGQKVYIDVCHINNEDRVDVQEWMQKCNKRQLGLDKFQISILTADEKIVQKFDFEKRNTSRFFWYCKELWLNKNVILNESDIKIVNGKLSKWKNYYIYGSFFNKDYICEVATLLQKEIKLKREIEMSKELKNAFNNKETISLHVRRGDFIKVGRDISGDGYYLRAVQYMHQKIENPLFLVFSDDIEWVKSNMLLGGNCIYVSEMGFQDYEELILMSMCKHNIIANSTFSYWGAWLNNNPEKIVLAPKGWRRKIIPDEWVRL